MLKGFIEGIKGQTTAKKRTRGNEGRDICFLYIFFLALKSHDHGVGEKSTCGIGVSFFSEDK